MKRRQVFFTALLFGAVLAAAGCAKEEVLQPSEAEQENSGNDAAVDADGTEKEEETVKEGAPQITITSSTKDWFSEDGSIWFVHGEYDMVSAGKDAAEALEKSMKEWSDKNQSAFFDSGDEASRYAAEDAALSIYPMGSESYAYSIFKTIEMTRSDSRAVSLLEMSSEYTGGAHGNYGYTSVVFDAQSGEVLTLDSLLEDKEGFQEAAADYIKEELKTKYKDGLFPEYADTVESMWENNPVWYLDASGITFVFDPYVVGPYAMGTAFATLPYEDFSGYLKPEYLLPESGGIAAQIPENKEVSLRFAEEKDSSGALSVQVEQKEEYADAQISLRLNENSVPLGTFARLGKAYFLNTKDERKYVLLDADYASDDFVTFVYEVTDGTLKETDRIEGLRLQGGTVHEEKLELSMHLDVLGSYSAHMDYVLDDHGKLEQQQEFFEISADSGPGSLLTVVRSLPVTMDSGTQKTSLPSGSVIRIIGSDNQGTVRFRVEGTGEEGSIAYTRGNGNDDEWTLYIDGVSEYDYFESIPYAG